MENCRFAAFQPPQRGDRIELPDRPGEYFLVVDKPQAGSDARGQPFWQARVKDPQGREQMLSSDRTKSWKHFSGPNHPWHDEELSQAKAATQKKDQESLISGFEDKHRFPDGQPLRTGRMLLSVGDGAPGDLGVLAGEKAYVERIDYKAETVVLKPVGDGLGDLSITAPAADVVSHASPALSTAAAREQVSLQSGERVSAEELMSMTPGLNRLAANRQVSLKVQVYVNYVTKGDNSGEDVFVRHMSNRGIAPEEVESATGMSRNNTPLKLDANGSRISPMGPYSGDVYISPPVPDDVLREVAMIAPKSQVVTQANGVLLVHSNPLYRQMVSLGVL
jgi:hypothetical protein